MCMTRMYSKTTLLIKKSNCFPSLFAYAVHVVPDLAHVPNIINRIYNSYEAAGICLAFMFFVCTFLLKAYAAVAQMLLNEYV